MAWWLAQAVQTLLVPAIDPTSTAATTATAEGSLVNTAIVVAFAALGVAFWPWRWLVPRSASARYFAVLLGAYVVWALASLWWSVDLSLTIRRLVQLACILVGCIGLGAGFYAREPAGEKLLGQHILWAGLIAAVVMWLAVLRSGDVSVFDPAWAAKDIGIGTRLGYPMAYALLAAVYLSRMNALTGWQLVSVVGLLVFSILMQKARFTIACALIATVIMAVTSFRWNWRWAIALMTLGTAVWVTAAVVALEGTRPLEPLAGGLYTYATLDTSMDTTASLTGRTPLWDELLLYAQDRPWLGYGFGAFWNPEFMDQIWAVVHWKPPVAHNGYLDEVLGTGVVGLVLILAVCLVGMFSAWLRSGPFATLVAISMLLFLLLNIGDSIMQSYFQFPFYAAVTAVVTLLARTSLPHAGVRRQ